MDNMEEALADIPQASRAAIREAMDEQRRKLLQQQIDALHEQPERITEYERPIDDRKAPTNTRRIRARRPPREQDHPPQQQEQIWPPTMMQPHRRHTFVQIKHTPWPRP